VSTTFVITFTTGVTILVTTYTVFVTTLATELTTLQHAFPTDLIPSQTELKNSIDSVKVNQKYFLYIIERSA
jgi:hypothetical protein